MTTIYKGALRYKKKAELLEIAKALNIDLVPASRGGHPSGIKREEFEVLIRDHLADHVRELKPQEQWSGLYESIENDHKRQIRNSMVGGNGNGTPKHASKSEASDLSDSPETPLRSPRKHSGARASSSTSTSRSLPNGLASLANQSAETTAGFSSAVAGSVGRSVGGLKERLAIGAQEAREEVEEAAEEISQATESFQHKLRLQYNSYSRKARKQFKHAQVVASDSLNITKALIAIEALTFFFSLTPTVLLSFSGNQRLSASKFVQSHGATATAGAIPPWALTIPDFRAFISIAFWQSILLWSLWTIAVPFFFAHLITFDRRNKASTLTFGLVRLFSILYLGVISGVSSSLLSSTIEAVSGDANLAGFNSSSVGFGWLSYAHVARHINPSTQLLFSAAIVSFSLYETLAARPRSS